MPSATSRLVELTIRAESEEIRRASDWLHAACKEHGVPDEPVERLVLCLNEVLANVIVHGGDSARSAPVQLSLEMRHLDSGGEAGVTVCDAGVAFDPCSVPVMQQPRSLEEASVGGLGIVMIRRCSDWLDYRNERGCNRLTFGARWSVR